MRGIVGLLLLTAIVYGFGLGHASLWDIDEAIYADISRNMAETGDWVFPVFNGEPRFDKPPLLFWISAASMSIFGPGEVSVRIGSFTFALLSVWLVYALGNRLYSHRAGLLGAAALASSLGWFIAGRIGLMDTGLSFFVGLCIYQLTRLSDDESGTGNLAPYVWMGVAAALGVLTKGPVTLILFGVTALLFLGPRKFVQVFVARSNLVNSVIGIAAFLVVALPWHIAIYARAGQAWWEDYFGYHMFSRFTQPLEEHGYGWYFYIVVLVVGLLPWTGHALAGLWGLVRRRRPDAGRDAGSDEVSSGSDGGSRGHAVEDSRLLLLWFAVVFVFFSVSRTKLPGYILPAFLPLAALMGAWCDRRLKRPLAERAFSVGLWASVAAGLLAVVGLFALRSIVPEGYEEAHRLLFLFPVTLIAGMLVTKGLHMTLRDAKTLLYGFMGTAFASMVLFTALLSPLIEEHKPVKPLVAAAKPHMTGKTLFISAFGDASSNYYLGLPVEYVHRTAEVRQLLDQQPNALALIPETILADLPAAEVIESAGPAVLVKRRP